MYKLTRLNTRPECTPVNASDMPLPTYPHDSGSMWFAKPSLSSLLALPKLIVRSHSEAVFRQTAYNFISCLENAFRHFGGVPKTLVIDNFKAAVTTADWYDPELNPKIESFCRHYGTVILPTKPYTPRHKGKIENGIAYVKSNALKGKRFGSLAEQNAYLLNWETNVADKRIHGTIRQQVEKVFNEVEKQALLPLPAGRFPSFEKQKSLEAGQFPFFKEHRIKISNY